MPGGLLAWGKSRFLRRKSPERAVHVVLPPEPRHVRFDDWTTTPSPTTDPPGRSTSTLNSTGSSSGAVARAPDWRYSDDVRVQIAPLARQEDVEARDRRAMSAPRNQPIRDTSEYAPIAKAFEDDQRGRGINDVNVVFLQRNDERGTVQVKRTMLPADIRTLRQVQAAFCRMFNLSMSYLQQPHVRIYIQEPRGQLFYELDDPMDIRDKSVLRLKEGRCPSPPRLEFLSEADLASSMTSSISARPASAMAAFAPQPPQYGPPKPLFDPYDPYASDTASSHDSRSVTRSGSATPVIDRDTRVRMDTMERQLAGLSSLVHSALKGMDETSVRDMEVLRRQVLSLQPDRLPSEEPPSLPDSSISGSRDGRFNRESSRDHTSRERDTHHHPRDHHVHQLAMLRERVQSTATEARQLRRVAQVNAQNSREIIRSAGDQIMKLIAERLGRRAESVIPTRAAEARREEHGRQLSGLLEDITSFERSVEEVRASVLNSNRKLRMSEVERLTTSLTEIGRTAAGLKTAIPEVHGASEAELIADVERARAERNEAVAAIDQSLRRCKALANIMVTMKKLAMVQDPSMQKTKGLPPTPSSPSTSSTSHPAPSSPPSNGLPPLPPPHFPFSSRDSTPPSPSLATSPPSTTNYKLHSSLDLSPPPPPPAPPLASNHTSASYKAPTPDPPPPVPPSPVHYTSPTSSLDGILREVASTPPPQPVPVSGPTSGPPLLPPSSPAGQPPRPPSRFSVRDARSRGPVVMGTATVVSPLPSTVTPGPPHTNSHPPSPSLDPESDARRARLEERQAQLAEKQRQLHTQFEQLQQLAPN